MNKTQIKNSYYKLNQYEKKIKQLSLINKIYGINLYVPIMDIDIKFKKVIEINNSQSDIFGKLMEAIKPILENYFITEINKLIKELELED